MSLLVVASTIIVLANLAPGTVSIGSGYDKLDHAFAFACLAPLAACAFPRTGIVTVFFGLTAFNAAIEVTQALLGLGRQPDVVDWGVGVLATLPVLAAIGLFRVIGAQRRRG